jgi:hypothetical protein
MLKFFRGIRRNLIERGNLKRYLIYAVGEILLIVLGILIAIQLGNINQSKNEFLQEQRILQDLNGEIASNLSSVDQIIYEKQNIIAICSLFLESTGKNAVWTESQNFDSLLVKTIVSGWKFNPENGVLLELINSGKLDLIKNKKLRYLLTSIPGHISQLQYEDEMVVGDMHTIYLPFLSENYAIRNTIRYDAGIMSEEQRRLLRQISETEFNASPEELLQNPQFENNIGIQLLWVNFSLNLYHPLKEMYNEALHLIESELDK